VSAYFGTLPPSPSLSRGFAARPRRKLDFHELPKTISGKIRCGELRRMEPQRVKDQQRSPLESGSMTSNDRRNRASF
jgi:hypothetical protein